MLIKYSFDVHSLPCACREFDKIIAGSESSLKYNGELLQDILQLCERSDRYGVENILLIGKSGAGKSALINTLVKVITGKYYDRAKVGKGSTQSKTLRIVQYKNCGVVEEDLRLSSNARGITCKQLRKLPNVYDVPGLGDSLADDIKEILRLLIAGRVPVGTGISALQKLQEEHGVGNLGVIYKNVDRTTKISKIVFVQSAADSVPKQLIESLQSVTQETDSSTGRLSYEGDVFLVITHYDLVQDEPEYVKPLLKMEEDGDMHEDSVYTSRSELKEKENNLADLFSIDGALERNLLFWRSFCDKTGYDYNDPEICNTALKFLKFMMSPSTPAAPTQPTPVMDVETWLRLKGHQMVQRLRNGDIQLNISHAYTAIAVCLLVAGYMLYRLLSAPVR